MEFSNVIRERLSRLSSRPGVYLMRDKLGRVIYVGKAKALNKRVRSYFQPGRYHQLDPKTRALVSMVADIETFEVKNETEAILLEGKLIKQYRPRYNISFRDDKRFLMVKLTRDPFPRFVLTRLQKPDGCRYFGPFIHSSALRNTLEYIRKTFHIRACLPTEPGEKDYKHCMNDILKHCSAPCMNRISPEDYHALVERSCSFLEGKDEVALQDLEELMRKAAARRDYEKAAVLRDALHDLRTTVKQSARKFKRDMPRIRDFDGELVALAEALNLPKPPRIIEGFDISHIYGQHTVGSMVHFVNGRPAKAKYRHFKIKGVMVEDRDARTGRVLRSATVSKAFVQNDDFASMREIVGRRYRRLKEEGKLLPDLVLIDGGRGQLNVALMALKAVGVELRVAGLAKDEEEIYLPDRDEPLKLPPSSPALQLLQRIRDEAHRFANTLHEGWRKKQIRFSMLDELPGLGARRKAALLKKFGSLEKVREAGVEELQKVEGFGKKSAEILWRFLHPTQISPD